NSCNTGPVQCCNDVHQSNSNTANLIHQVFGINIPVTGNVGTQCSPITAVGVGSGAQCSSQPVCCENNHYEGLIVVGCTPININI
ncbi:hydrophobin, partial [Crepidotus variabilis]